MNDARFELVGARRKVLLHGGCLELISLCQAMCCREWVVSVTAEEFATGQYDAEAVCELTSSACRIADGVCLSRRYQLRKREDGSCVYLDDNLCRIYADRPKVCRQFTCKGGWRLDSVASGDDSSSAKKMPTLAQDTFVRGLNDEMIFVQHPLVRVYTVFCLAARKQIVFVKRMAGACGKLNTRDDFDHPQIDDARMLLLIDLFGSREALGQIYRRFCLSTDGNVTREEFLGIVWLLNKHNIILDSRHFRGMLSGMGGINPRA